MNEHISCNSRPDDGLVDIRDVRVDKTLPRKERIAGFVRQVGNPYLFRCGDITVSTSYTQGGPTLEECLLGILR